MSERESLLLEAIARAPADDAPRLVYADWLSSEGHPWGEFIHVSCELSAQRERTAQSEALWERRQQLIERHARTWLAPVDAPMKNKAFRRGLLGHLECRTEVFLAKAEAIALRAPRASLELNSLSNDDAPALALAPLGRFRRVRLSSRRFTTEGLRVLADSPAINGVEQWQLAGVFDDDALRALADSPHLEHVEALWLDEARGPFTGAGLAALLSSHRLGRLQSLTIGSVASTDGAFAHCTVPLRSLSLHAQAISRVDEEALNALLPNLEQFAVSGCEAGERLRLRYIDASFERIERRSREGVTAPVIDTQGCWADQLPPPTRRPSLTFDVALLRS